MMDEDEWEYLVSPRHHHRHHHELIYYDQPPPAFLDHEVTAHPPPPHDDHLPPPHPNKTATLFPTTSCSGGDGDEEILLLVKMDHFICPPPPSSSTTRSPSTPDQKDRDGVIPVIRRLSLNIAENYRDISDVSHLVFFRKMMETQQFVDMKLEKENSSSPTSPTHQMIPSDPQQQTKITGATTIGFAAQEHVDSPDLNKYEQEEEDPITTTSSIWQQTEGEKATSAGGGGGRSSSSLLNIWWKWGFTGIGALCSFGVAATTISIVLFTTPHHRHTATRFHHPHHLHTPHQHEGMQRMKQVAQRAAAIGVLNLKDATISAAAARVPLGISFGGGAYHDGR